MISIPHKAKQFGVFIIKLLIVIGAFYFIYDKLTSDKSLNWEKFWKLADEKFTFSVIFGLLLMSFANRFFEILKWQNLVSTIHTISVGEATKQVLGALAAGIFTPNGIGEYAGKALYFDKNQTKKVVFLNLICNGIQMILTIVFGTIGLFILGYWQWGFIIIGLSIFFFLFSILSKNITIKGYSIEKLMNKINEIPKHVHKRNNLLALCRFLTFSHQYYFLFLVFGVDLPYATMMATIAVVYFLASSLPSFQFLDFAVKGSVAVFFFGKLGVNDWIVVFVATLMWFLNVVLPVVMGCYYVLKYKPKWN
ncbi:MAG TPA: hypothetical protein PLP39_05345 [Flavobacterium lutivivi]|nr:hypothetical protein [Flavobacterium lutivivi]